MTVVKSTISFHQNQIVLSNLNFSLIYNNVTCDYLTFPESDEKEPDEKKLTNLSARNVANLTILNGFCFVINVTMVGIVRVLGPHCCLFQKEIGSVLLVNMLVISVTFATCDVSIIFCIFR